MAWAALAGAARSGGGGWGAARRICIRGAVPGRWGPGEAGVRRGLDGRLVVSAILRIKNVQ